jgi:hypothetical protein
MSREVEVKNIKLTASVPEDLQISLGELSTTDGSGNGYMNNYGNLVPETDGGLANNGGVAEPRDVIEDWANTVDVSKYYALGTIIPASSTDGQAVFFTPDAAGVGKELKTNAKFYQAVANDSTEADGTTNAMKTAGKEYTQTYETTLHAYTGKNDTTGAMPENEWTPDAATSSSVTLDSGYYVDIPVWIRSASKEDCNLAVDAYVTTNSTIDGDDLYLAARAVILDEDKAATSGLLEIKQNDYSSTTSIVNFMTTTNANGEAVSAVAGTVPTYDTEDHYDGSLMTSLFTVPAAEDDENYGDAVKVWVRVWLEGEDPNCWNDNAGQDFNISLKFTKDRLYNTADLAASSDANKPEAANYPTANAFNSGDDAVDADTITRGDQVTVSGTITDANDSTGATTVAITMVYEYDGTAWSRLSGSYPGKTIYVGGTAMSNEAALITYITNNKTTKTSTATAITFTETNS